MPRVVLFAPYPHVIGGMERVTESLAIALPDAGWEVTVVAPSGGILVDRLRARQIAVEVVPAPPSLRRYGGRPRRGQALKAAMALPRYWWLLRRVLAQATLVHTGEHRGALMVGPAARLAGVPMVWQVHSVEESRPLNLLSALLATEIVVPTAACGDAVGWLPRQPLVVPNPIDAPPLRPQRSAQRSEAPLVLSCGRLHPVKNFDGLLRALSILHRRGLAFRAVLAGGLQAGHEAHADALAQLVEQLGLNGVVELAGFTDRPFERWAHAAVYVQPSKHETFGLAAAEAMAAGFPAVVTRVGGLAELVDDGRTGLTVPAGDDVALADAIERLLRHPREAELLGAAGRNDIGSRFGQGVDAIVAVYESVPAVSRCRARR